VREDVRQLGAIAILAADNLLLLLVVVPAGKQVAKDHLRNEDLLCGVLFDGNTITIILYADEETGCRDASTHLNVLDGRLTRLSTPNKSIPSIHDNLIKELVEARVESAVAIDHLPLLCIKDPAHLIVRLYRPNVGVRQLQNVLPVRVLLIGIGGRHFVIPRVGVMAPSNLIP
jgi:hypothetical protein